MHAILRTTSLNGQTLETERLICIVESEEEASDLINEFTNATCEPVNHRMLEGLNVILYSRWMAVTQPPLSTIKAGL